MTVAVTAVYERGVLRPLQPVALSEGALVDLLLAVQQPMPSHSDSASLLAEIAALPDEGLTDPFSGRAHDQTLYGETGAGELRG